MSNIFFLKKSLWSIAFYFSLIPLVLSVAISCAIGDCVLKVVDSHDTAHFITTGLEVLIAIAWTVRFDIRYSNTANDVNLTSWKVLLFNLVLFMLLNVIIFNYSLPANMFDCQSDAVLCTYSSGLFASMGVILNGLFLDSKRNNI